MIMLHFQWYPFQALTVVDLYEILKLRSHVFVVEQKCAYLDVDGKDAQALHLLGKVKGTLVAYLRLFPPSVDQPSLVFGRVVVAASMRKKGYGRGLMHAMLTHCDANFPGIGIKCSAQY